jgi:chromosome segregation ATPase
MVHIRRVELRGFKAFPNRKIIEFEKNGIQVFTGNDSLDLFKALRFAFMETRVLNLGCKRLSDLIFDTDTNNEINILLEDVGEVFDGSKSAHIRRKYFRSGTSEYLLNWLPCKLNEIKDKFAEQICVESITVWGNYDRKRFVELSPETRQRLWDIPLGIRKKMHQRSNIRNSVFDRKFQVEQLEEAAKELSKQLYTAKKNSFSTDWDSLEEESIDSIESRRKFAIEKHAELSESLETRKMEYANLNDEIISITGSEFIKLNQVFAREMKRWTGISAKLAMDTNNPFFSGMHIEGLPDSMSLQEHNAIGWAFWSACMMLLMPPVALLELDSEFDAPNGEQISSVFKELSPHIQILVFVKGNWAF